MGIDGCAQREENKKTLSALHPSSHINDDTFFCSSSSQVRSTQTYQRRDLQRRLPAGWITSMDTRVTKEEVRLLSSSLDFCFSSLTFLNLPLLCVCVSVLVQREITLCILLPRPTTPSLNSTGTRWCPTSGNAHHQRLTLFMNHSVDESVIKRCDVCVFSPSVPTVSEDVARDALLKFVESKWRYSSKPARNLTFKELKPVTVYRVGAHLRL